MSWSFCISDTLSVGALLTLLDYFKIVRKDILTTEFPEDCPQPTILYTGDVWTTQDFIIQGSKLCVANDLVFAFELLLNVYYVFNISYAAKKGQEASDIPAGSSYAHSGQ